MSKAVVIKKLPHKVGGKLVKVNEQCRLPDGLADAMAAEGLCTIVGDTVDGALEPRDDPEAKEAVKVAADTKKARAAGLAKAEAEAKKPAPKKRPAPKKKATPKKKAKAKGKRS